MYGAYSPYGAAGGPSTPEPGKEPISVQGPKQPPTDPRKDRARQLAWKFFTTGSSTAYQLDLFLRPIPASASPLLREQGAGNVAELLINGVRVHATATPGSLRKPTEFTFTVSEDTLPELQHATIAVRLEEDAKGKLGGFARVGKDNLPIPEAATGEGIQAVRRLTWRLVHADSCYYLSYTVMQRFAVSQIAINGFPVHSRKHSVFQQLPFKAAKYDVDINERGLGELHGQRLTLKAELSRQDVIEAVAKINDRLLAPPDISEGMDPRLEELLGDAPRGWVAPQSAIKLQASGKFKLLPPLAPSTPSPRHLEPSTSSAQPEIQPAPSRRSISGPAPGSPNAAARADNVVRPAARTVRFPPTHSPAAAPRMLETVPEVLMQSKASEDALSLQASAELEEMGRQKSGRSIQLEDTQVLAALANMDSFGTSSDDLISEPSGEISRQASGDGIARQKSAEGRSRRLQAAAELARQRSVSDELLKDVEAATNQTAQELAAMSSPTKAQLNAAAADDMTEGKRKDVSAALARALRGSSDSQAELLATPPQSLREAPLTAKSDARSERSGNLSELEDDMQRLPAGPARAKAAGWLPAAWSDEGSTGHGGSPSGPPTPAATSTADAMRNSFESVHLEGGDILRGEDILDLAAEGRVDPTSPVAPILAASVRDPASALAAAQSGDPVHWCLDRNAILIARTADGKRMRIGEGSSGTVYKALMHGCDDVAVKLIRAATPTEKDRDTFRREVLMLHALRHRNIVQFYGACLEPNCYFIVTELMTGGDMYTALRRCPGLMAWNKMGQRIAVDVALGLNYLHSRRPAYAHRDLKSPNVLLTREGVAKIGDVGLMRAQVDVSLTAQNSWTPLWAAPEVIRHERASIKADIWSFGIIIWELVSLQNVADFPSMGMACQMKVGHCLKLPKMCPPNAARVFYECTKPKADDRPDILSIVEWLREEDSV